MPEPPPELSTVHKAAWGGFLLTHVFTTRAINSVLASMGEISLEQYDVLLALEESESGCLTMTQLADAIVFSPSGLTRMVDCLSKKGLVERCQNPKDKRSILARITPEGRRARELAWHTYSKLIQEHFGRHMSEPEARAMVELSQRILSRETWPGHNNCAE